MLRSYLIAMGLMISLDVSAHTDTVIRITTDGNLEGFPPKYSPAHFDISTWTLSIGESQFIFPGCISDRLSTLESKEFSLISSWYHPTWINDGKEIPRLPDYLIMRIKSQALSIPINLATAKPFDINSRKYAALSNERICELLQAPNK